MDVHWPYHLEERLIDPGEIAQAWRDVVHLHNANWNRAVITSAQREHYIRLYEEAVAYIDQQLGVLFDFLESSGLEEDTSIIVLADHGEEFQEHGRWGHWEDNLHDEIIKVPLLIKPPGLIRRQVIEEQVRLLDIMPTILDICECPSPENMLGTSLRPLWEAENNEHLPRVAISEMWRDTWHIIAVRTEGYKLIWDNKQPNTYRLYNLSRDPEETVPVEGEDEQLIAGLLSHVHKTLELMENTRQAASAPYLDDAMISRLRDLGYLQ
jgi:arylsulfatase A-like enzyme